MVRIMESTFDTTLTALSSTTENFKQRPSWKLISSTSFCSPTTVHWTLLASLQNSVDKFSMTSDNFGLTISTKKTEVMHQPAPGKPFVEPYITIKGQRLKVIEKFTHLGNTLSKSIVIDDEVNTALAKASANFGRLGGNQNQGIPSCRPYHHLLWLWNMDNLSMTYEEAKPLSHNLYKEDSRHPMAKTHPDTEVLTRTSLPRIYTILMQS